MSIAETLLPEFDHEMSVTRKYLERLPDAKFSYQPHKKSMKLGDLVTHLVEIPSWGVVTLEAPSFDVSPANGPKYERTNVTSSAQAVALFDDHVSKARQAIMKATDAVFYEPWSLLSGGATIFTMPKIAVMRSFVIKHSVHHRAQLGVYLRLNDVPVPATYGPSADEGSL